MPSPLVSASSSSATIPTLTASRRARALARVSAIRIRAVTIIRDTFPGSASPIPVKVPRSVVTSARQMAICPFSLLGACRSWVLISFSPCWWAWSSSPA